MIAEKEREALLARVVANLDAETAFLARLVQVPSLYSEPAAKEQCQDVICDQLGAFGADVDRWMPDYAAMGDFYAPSEALFPEYIQWRNCSNAVGRRRGRGRGRSLLLNGHIDVAEIGDAGRWSVPPWSGVVGAGKLHGRGACGQKAGLAGMLFAVRAIVECGIPLSGDALLAAVVDEESSGNGTRACLSRGYSAESRA